MDMTFRGSLRSAFKVYLREYLCKSEIMNGMLLTLRASPSSDSEVDVRRWVCFRQAELAHVGVGHEARFHLNQGDILVKGSIIITSMHNDSVGATCLLRRFLHLQHK